jgi:Lrp/AsnC family transcriptional regulator, regulator for asnA, asnC and gidA
MRPSSKPVLDAYDKNLIEQLQNDGRLSYAALAKQVGLSETAVRQRVQRLLDAGVMQVVAVTDPLTLGFRRQAMIGIRVDGDTRAVTEALQAVAEIDYVVVCAGGYDILAEIVCADDDHLLTVLDDEVRAIPGVLTAETFVYLKLMKQTYAWGTS